MGEEEKNSALREYKENGRHFFVMKDGDDFTI